MNEYYNKEMERLEKQQKELHDRYNSEPMEVEKSHYKKLVNSKIALAPTMGETIAQYLQRIKIYQKIAFDKNWTTHVDNPYKTWHQHKNPMGCFMCDDTTFIGVLVQVLEIYAEKYPDMVF